MITATRDAVGHTEVSRAQKGFILTCIVLAFVLFLIDCLTPLGVSEAMLYAFVVLLSSRTREGRVTLALAALSTFFIGVGFAVSPPGADLWISITNRCLAIVLVWATTGILVRHLRVELERDIALREREEDQAHINVLHGLLPICAWCRKIRETDGQWVNLESYIAQHSEAEFTHSICPECMRTEIRGKANPR